MINEIFLTETNISMYFDGDGTRSNEWNPPIDKTRTHQISEMEAMINDKELHKYLLNVLMLCNMKDPTTLQNIRSHQQADAQLLDALQTTPRLFQYITINDVEVVFQMGKRNRVENYSTKRNATCSNLLVSSTTEPPRFTAII